MRELISDTIAEASTQRAATAVAEIAPRPDIRPAPKPEPRPEAKPKLEAKAEPKSETKSAPQSFSLASAESVPVTLTSRSDPSTTTTIQVPRWTSANTAPTARAAPMVGSADPIRPVPVKTLSVRAAGAVQTASLVPLHVGLAEQPATAAAASAQPAPQAAPAPVPQAVPTAAPQSDPTAQPAASLPAPSKTEPAAPVARAGVLGALPFHLTTGSVAEAAPAASPPAPPTTAAPRSPAPVASQQVHTGWIIQVGAFPAEDEAKQRLSAVQSRASRYLASADPFTESVNKGATTLYRARFAGLGKEQAEAACNYLKHNDVDCMTIKN
jgi:D-alanyl-D-alanine carboxypeptidase